MFQIFYPYEYLDSPFAIDYRKLYHAGFRGLIFDIDNTLVPHGADSTEEVDALFRELHDIGFKTVLLSDNTEERTLRFIRNIDTMYVCDADKPKNSGFVKALKLLGMKRKRVIYIGDQMFRDTFGANKAGIPNILVKYPTYGKEKNIGIRRKIENRFLKMYLKNESYCHRLGDIEKDDWVSPYPKAKKKLFCEISPLTFAISTKKEILKRNLQDFLRHEKMASELQSTSLPVVISAHDSGLIKRGPGIDATLQQNKADNIRLACSKMDGLIIHPGETYSFWKLVGNTTKKNGFKEGRVITNKQLIAGMGGGLCNLANTIHYMVLLSPLEVTELHHHSDALAADPGWVRKPYSAGTSVSYNNIDFRFTNPTDQDIQLRVWCDDNNDQLHGELRTTKEFPWTYAITEEDHHFSKEGDKYYRISRIYRETKSRETGELLNRELNWDNHSEVMFDPAMIPAELIRN